MDEQNAVTDLSILLVELRMCRCHTEKQCVVTKECVCIMKSEEDSHHSHRERGQRNEEGKVENCTHIKRCVFYLSPMLGNVGSGGG